MRAERELMLYPCSHCGTERIVTTLSEMVGFFRKNPLPGILGALDELRGHVGSEALVALCPGCFCLTSDLSDHRDH
jgi:hypothetical protein